MSNHVHLIVIPRTPRSLALALKHTHGRYAAYWNAGHASSGHVWQGRFYSCPLDDAHLWRALRYVEMNPVRAGMVQAAVEWPWSSAVAHCSSAAPKPWLELELWQQRWTLEEWTAYLAARESPADTVALRQCTHSGRPLGTSTFVAELEKATLRTLAPQKRGRRKDSLPTPAQGHLAFAA